MKKIRRITMLVAVSLLFTFVYACVINTTDVKVTVTNEYKEIRKVIDEKVKEYGNSEVLIVLDIDNTILTSNVDLGGDIWYQWQRGKLDLKPTPEQKIDRCFYEDVVGLLYECGTMVLTDSMLPGYINEWQKAGIPMFALTSRSPRYRTPTERELSKRGIDMTKTAIRPEGKELPLYRYSLKRELSYMKGIMMTSGMNKGEMLAHILEKTGRSFKAIVFVDDSEKNVKNLKAKFETVGGIDMTIFHYRKIEEERIKANDGIVLTKEQAEKMANDWNKLNNTLLKIFPGRDVEGGCVSPD